MACRLGVAVDNILAAWSGNRAVGKAAYMAAGKVVYTAADRVVGKVVDKVAAADTAVGTVAVGNRVEDKGRQAVTLRRYMAAAEALAARLQAAVAVAWGVPSPVVETVVWVVHPQAVEGVH